MVAIATKLCPVRRIRADGFRYESVCIPSTMVPRGATGVNADGFFLDRWSRMNLWLCYCGGGGGVMLQQNYGCRTQSIYLSCLFYVLCGSYHWHAFAFCPRWFCLLVLLGAFPQLLAKVCLGFCTAFFWRDSREVRCVVNAPMIESSIPCLREAACVRMSSYITIASG